MNFLFCTVKMKSESKPLSTPTFSFFNKSSEKHKQCPCGQSSVCASTGTKRRLHFSPLSSAVWGPRSQRYLRQEVQSARGEICHTDAPVSYRHRGSQVKQKGHGRPQRDHHRHSHRLAARPSSDYPLRLLWHRCTAVGSLHLVAAVTEPATPTTVHNKDNDVITSEWLRRDINKCSNKTISIHLFLSTSLYVNTKSKSDHQNWYGMYF